VLIAVGSVVNKDIPSGCLAGGVPAKIIRADCYPRKLPVEEKKLLMKDFIAHFEGGIIRKKSGVEYDAVPNVLRLRDTGGDTVFHISEKFIEGHANVLTELLKNELRRYGIRFKSYQDHGEYVGW
jgi:hypothetical protein